MVREIRLTFLGDLMCQMQQISAVRKAGCGYDAVFNGVSGLWAGSDYVVANLETPIDRKSRLAYEEVRFNAPSAFLDAIANAHIGCLTCANNHILDRGKSGIDATLDEIEKRGIDAVGAYKTKQESDKVFIKELDGIRFAFIACTYDMNPGRKANMLKEDDLWKVDLLRHPAPWPGSWGYAVRRTLIGLVPYKAKQWLKRKRHGKNYVNAIPQSDCAAAETFSLPEHSPFINRIVGKIKSAKKVADVVVALPHIGGQYNSEPGEWQLLVTDALIDAGADLVIANHAHTPLRAEHRGRAFVAHAIGNFCFTPKVGFYNDSCQADYSIVLNCFFDSDAKKLSRKTFSVVKTVTLESGISVVRRVGDDEIEEVNAVCQRVSGKVERFNVKQEYDL